jgi:hypothetical protein
MMPLQVTEGRGRFCDLALSEPHTQRRRQRWELTRLHAASQKYATIDGGLAAESPELHERRGERDRKEIIVQEKAEKTGCARGNGGENVYDKSKIFGARTSHDAAALGANRYW